MHIAHRMQIEKYIAEMTAFHFKADRKESHFAISWNALRIFGIRIDKR